jgi:Fe-S oxidoreductase
MDKLKDFMYTMESCNSCGQCRFVLGPKGRGWDHTEVCPIYSRFLFESYSGQGLINIAQELLEGTLQYDESLMRHIYTCTTCGACDVNCKSVRDMEVMDTILALREKCVEDGRGPLPAHRQYAVNVAKEHNIYGQPHQKRFDWLPQGLRLNPEAPAAYFAGCNTSYQHPGTAINTIKLLDAAGMDFKLLGLEEFCCGAPLWRTGQVKEAVKLVEHNLQVLKKLRIKTLIVSCAECYGTFRGFYPRIAEPGFEVLHISEVLAGLLQDKRIQFTRPLRIKAAYHDPCLLGRLSEQYVPWQGEVKAYGLLDPPKKFRRGTHGVYRPPRQVLEAIPGLTLVEMPRNAENAYCCGGGGGVPDAFPDFSVWTTEQRIAEALSTGAQALVSACPFCESNFKSAIGSLKSPISYYDLTELAAAAI